MPKHGQKYLSKLIISLKTVNSCYFSYGGKQFYYIDHILVLSALATLQIEKSFVPKFARARLGSGRSVTRWLDYFSILGHVKQWKLAKKHINLSKMVIKFCQILI